MFLLAVPEADHGQDKRACGVVLGGIVGNSSLSVDKDFFLSVPSKFCPSLFFNSNISCIGCKSP